MTGTHTGSRTEGIPSTDGTSTGSTSQRTKDAVGSATDVARETGSAVTSAATNVASDLAHKAASTADDRKAELMQTARAIQEKAAEFATSIVDEQPQVGHALQQVTDRADQLVSYVESSSVEDMTQDFSTQMRRHPMLFAAGMFGLGFALSRVLKPVDPGVGQQRQLTTGSGGSY